MEVPSFGCKEYNQYVFSIKHLVWSTCRLFFCGVGRRCLLWPMYAPGQTLLPFPLLHFVLHSQICLLFQVSHFFLLFKKIIYFNWRIITLQHCSGFCHILTWISHGYTCVPHPEHPSHLPSHPIPQGHPNAPALSILSHASNLDWQSISHMIIYMFQCYSLKSSHPRLLPQSTKLCFYICVSFAVSHIGSSLLSF